MFSAKNSHSNQRLARTTTVRRLLVFRYACIRRGTRSCRTRRCNAQCSMFRYVVNATQLTNTNTVMRRKLRVARSKLTRIISKYCLFLLLEVRLFSFSFCQLQIDYPLQKLDLIAIPDFEGESAKCLLHIFLYMYFVNRTAFSEHLFDRFL
jgi:hypothetical protein